MSDQDGNRENKLHDIMTNPLAGRRIIMRPETFVTFQKRVEAILGSDTKALFYEAGITSGRNAINIKLQLSEKRGVELLQLWSEAESSLERGWGKFEDLNVDLSKGLGSTRLLHSFIGEAYGTSNKPVCDFICGYFVGILQELTGKILTGEEITCIATGDSYCTFKIYPVEE